MSGRLILLKCTSPCTLLLKDPHMSFPQRRSPATSAGPVSCSIPPASPPRPSHFIPTHLALLALSCLCSGIFSFSRLDDLACFTSPPLLSLSSAQAGPAPTAAWGSSRFPQLSYWPGGMCFVVGALGCLFWNRTEPLPLGEVLEGDGPASVLPVPAT